MSLESPITYGNDAGSENVLRRTIVIQVAILLSLYCAVSPFVAMPLYNRILFFPDKQNYDSIEPYVSQIEKRFGSSRKIVFFKAPDGQRLNAWYFKTKGADKVVLISHGNAGNLGQRIVLALALISCGASVFMYDYEGYGQSEGAPTIPNVCDDGIAAFDYLVNSEKVKPSNIVLYGESLGTGVTCKIAKQRQPGGIILQSGFPSLLYAAHDRLWFTWLYPNDWFADLDNLETLKHPHPPLLIIHGRQDPNFPWRYAQVLYDKACEPKQLAIIDEMGHYVDQNAIVKLNALLKTYLQQMAPHDKSDK